MTEHKDVKDDEREERKEDEVEKSAFDSSLQALTETIKGFDISGLKEEISGIGRKVDSFDSRIKAMETPTDLPLKPKTSAEDDIGAKVKVPDDYQSNSNQAGIRESDAENAEGHEDLGAVGRRILKGDFGSPEQGEQPW